jgi:AcrR family transcriptional regulator
LCRSGAILRVANTDVDVEYEGVGSLAIETERPNGPRTRKGERTRARLADAAKEIFEESGFLDARVADIAERAGLSHGSFYHYFESKEQVFREVAEGVYERLSAPLGTVILDPASAASPPERLQEAIRRHLESYRREARIIGVIEQVSRYDDHIAAMVASRHRVYRDQIAGSIRQIQRRGQADPTVDADIAAAALGAMISRFAEMWMVQDLVHCGLNDGAEQLTKLFVNALGVRSVEPAARRRRRVRVES